MKKLSFLLLPLFIISCTTQKIVYTTDDVKLTSSVETIPIMVDIRILDDNRQDVAENEILFNKPHQVKIDGTTKCINSEKHYDKSDSVVNQVTRLFVDHCNKAKLFRMSFYDHSKYSNYYLAGKLKSFYGEQEFSTGAAVGAQFGLIGALATSGIKTPGTIRFEVSGLKLYRKDGTLIKDIGSFYKEYNDDFKADAYCWCIYWNVNEKLKDFNAHLIEKIRMDLSEEKFL